MVKTIDYINSKDDGLKSLVNKDYKKPSKNKVRLEKRLFALRNIASEALNEFINNEYNDVR